MLLTKEVEFDINAVKGGERVAVKRYWDVGTVVGDKLVVPISKLVMGSSKKIRVKCDYCGTEFTPMYCSWAKQGNRRIDEKDACGKCRIKKSQETCMQKYGALSSFGNEEVRKGLQEIWMGKYGAKSPLDSKEIQSKICQTNLERYGAKRPLQNETIRGKSAQTIKERYGVDNIMHVDSIVEKAVKTRSENNITKSKPQIEMYKATQALGYECEIDYRLRRYEFDVAVFVDGQKIDLEYDGMYWHQNREEHDKVRDETTTSEGWKVIRFQAAHGTEIPTKEQIKAAIDTAIYDDRKLQIIQLTA